MNGWQASVWLIWLAAVGGAARGARDDYRKGGDLRTNLVASAIFAVILAAVAGLLAWWTL